MDYLKREFNKTLPLALLCGAVGGVLIIIYANLLHANIYVYGFTYLGVIGTGLCVLNVLRHKHQIISSAIYSFSIYGIMTVIAGIDVYFNANPNFQSPLFSTIAPLISFMVLAIVLSVIITRMFQKELA